MTAPVSRRAFLRAAATAAAAGALGTAIPWSRLGARAATPSGTREGPFAVTGGVAPELVFPQSVASGDPTPHGAIVWTRVAPEALRAGVDLALEIARDEQFADVVHGAVIPRARIRAEDDHTVRVDLDGLLASDARYFYRFLYDGVATRTGRLRTLPAPGAPVDRVRFAVLTCQNFQNGYFTALGHVAQEDVDFVVHVGDFIYEYNGAASYNGKTFPGRDVRLPSGGDRMQTKEDLSYVWQRYRSDPHLMAMLERHTLIATWDDHEVANDRFFDYDEGRFYGDDGFALNGDAAALDRFFRDGAKAYFDWLPLRIEIDPDAEDPLDVIRLYRSFAFGDLVELFMLDERWFRSPPPHGQDEQLGREGDDRNDPARTMLGHRQRDWLAHGLRGSSRRWKVLGNPVQMSPLAATLPGTGVFVNLDAWDGYEHERRALADVLADVSDAVVLTGDLHSYMAGYVMRDYHAPLPRRAENVVAVEFMTPGVTSAGLGEIVEQATGKPVTPGDDEAYETVVLSGNPHMVHFNSTRHGYSVVEFTPAGATYRGYIVDKTRPTLAGNRHLLGVFEVASGSKTLRVVERRSPSGLPLAPPQVAPPAKLAEPPVGATVVRDLHDVANAFRSGAGPAVARRLTVEDVLKQA